MASSLTWRAAGTAAPAVPSLGCGVKLAETPEARLAPERLALGPGETPGAEAIPSRAGELAFDWRLEPLAGGLSCRLRVTHRGAAPIRLDRLIAAEAPALDPGVPMTEWAFYQHGWMSWAPTIIRRVLGADRLVEPREDRRTYHAHNTPQAPDEPGALSSSEVTLVGTAEAAFCFGFLDLGEHLTALTLEATGAFRAEVLLEGRMLAPGETLVGPRLWIAWGRPEELLDTYAGLTAPGALPDATPHGGWCTWYYYYGLNDAADLGRELAAMDAHAAIASALDWVIIDDGHQAAIGDWLDTRRDRYPEGLKALASRIRAEGQAPGLWLAPFCVRSDARLYAEHPDWVVRDPETGAPAPVWHHWGGPVYGLDLTHPAVLDHLRRLTTTLTAEWGFTVLKLDFLHFGAQPGRRHDPACTGLNAVRRGLAAIREAAGIDVHLLGCGAPMASSLGLVYSMRVGQDVGLSWRGDTPENMSSVSTMYACMNTVLRLWQHRKWWVNDPDCVLIRENGDAPPGVAGPAITEAERRFLLTVVALTGGSTISGDSLATLSPARWRQLGQLLPPTGLAARWVGGFKPSLPDVLHLGARTHWDAWHLVALLNWDDAARTVSLPWRAIGLAGPHELFDVWEGRPRPAAAGAFDQVLPPHGAALLALRPVREHPWLLGDDRHFAQGLAGVADCRFEAARMTLVLELLPTPNPVGRLWLSVPGAYRVAEVQGLAPNEAWTESGEGACRLDLEVRAPRVLQVRFTGA